MGFLQIENMGINDSGKYGVGLGMVKTFLIVNVSEKQEVDFIPLPKGSHETIAQVSDKYSDKEGPEDIVLTDSQTKVLETKEDQKSPCTPNTEATQQNHLTTPETMKEKNEKEKFPEDKSKSVKIITAENQQSEFIPSSTSQQIKSHSTTESNDKELVKSEKEAETKKSGEDDQCEKAEKTGRQITNDKATIIDTSDKTVEVGKISVTNTLERNKLDKIKESKDDQPQAEVIKTKETKEKIVDEPSEIDERIQKNMLEEVPVEQDVRKMAKAAKSTTTASKQDVKSKILDTGSTAIKKDDEGKAVDSVLTLEAEEKEINKDVKPMAVLVNKTQQFRMKLG